MTGESPTDVSETSALDALANAAADENYVEEDDTEKDHQNASQIDKIFRKKIKLANDDASGDSPPTKTVKRLTKTRRKKHPPRRYVDPSVKLNTIQVNRKARTEAGSNDDVV